MVIPYVINRTSGDNHQADIFSAMLAERSIFLTGTIDENSSSTIIAELLFLESQDHDKPINLYIDSFGGIVTAGLAIIDTIKHISCPVRTLAIGQAFSMAAVILATGDERYVLPYSRIMIHQPSGGMQGKQTDMLIASQEISLLRNAIVEILSAHTGKSTEELESDLEKDLYMSASEAVKYGLADDVLLPNPYKIKFKTGE